MVNISETFTLRLNEALKESGIKKVDIQRRLQKSKQTVFNWFNGVNWPSPQEIDIIAEMLGVTPQWLFGANPIDKGRDQLVLEIIGATQKLKDKTNLEAVKTLAVGLLEDEQEKENLIQPESKAQ